MLNAALQTNTGGKKLTYKILTDCFQTGLFGFAVIFTFLLLYRLFYYALTEVYTFQMGIEDVKTAFEGFVLFYIVDFLRSIIKNRKKRSNK